MAAKPSSEDTDVIDGSNHQFILETSQLVLSKDESELCADDIDFWGEDDKSNGTEGDGSGHSSVLQREWVVRHEQFHTMGYRDGITAGKEASAQEGFNVGFKQSVQNSYNWGLVRGFSSAYSNLPDHLKEKLSGTMEKREMILNLYQSAQLISATDALKLYHQSIIHNDSSQGSHSLINDGEFSGFNCLYDHFNQLISILLDSPEMNLKLEPRQEAS